MDIETDTHRPELRPWETRPPYRGSATVARRLGVIFVSARLSLAHAVPSTNIFGCEADD